MSSSFALLIVNALGIYAAVGLVFAIAFVARGVSRVDPTAEGGTVGFRLAIVPGVAALWPLLLVRWLRAADDTAPPVERNAHRDAARARATAEGAS